MQSPGAGGEALLYKVPVGGEIGGYVRQGDYTIFGTAGLIRDIADVTGNRVNSLADGTTWQRATGELRMGSTFWYVNVGTVIKLMDNVLNQSRRRFMPANLPAVWSQTIRIEDDTLNLWGTLLFYTN